ncbi:MAG: VCBS repeat-containing protein [Lacunisphaera sp.]
MLFDLLSGGTLLAFLLFACSMAAKTARDEIVQQGFEQFAAGTLGNAGANMYVSRDGRIQVINRWDLNDDGYNDVVMSNDHNDYEVVDAFVYWGTRHGYKSLLPDLWRERPLGQVLLGLMTPNSGLTRLPAFGGGKSLVADLNHDGYADIVFCNYIHNYPGNRAAYIYWGGPDGYKPEHRTELPTLWAAGVDAADLNGDGYPELVFANQGTEYGLSEAGNAELTGSYIYWGSATGFNPSHRTVVGTHGAVDVAIADVNHDGFADLAFINRGPAGNDLQVFYGGAAKYGIASAQTVAVYDPTSICAHDLNRDGYADLVVTTSAPPQTIGYAGKRESDPASKPLVYLFMGSAAGISDQNKSTLPTLQARGSTVADLNGDGWPDIAIANASNGTTSLVPSYVYWGSKDGFVSERRTELPTLGANAVASADLNGDGQPDLVFANSNNDQVYDVPSYIYWGSATGYAPYLRSDLQSFGAVSVNLSDLNRDGIIDAILVNQYAGTVHEINSHIYWGNPHHYYSPASMTSLPSHGAYGTAAVDFNNDGYCDLVICNSYQNKSYLYWGGTDGFSPTRRQELTVGRVLACCSADLNRDGFLDLIFVGSVNGERISTILWGSAGGYADDRKTELKLKGKASDNANVADLNHDGYLDLVFNDSSTGTLDVFWGGAQEYSGEHSSIYPTSPGALKLADLNGDGFLDFIIAGSVDEKTKSNNAKTRIFWGTATGAPSAEGVIELEAYSACEVSIADLNRDGYLDLVGGNYMSDTTRSLPIFVFWGEKDGKYSDRNRLELPAESSCGVETIDLNRDGYPEIVVHNHLKDGIHSINSYIYWNGPDGFALDRRTEVPSFGPHYTTGRDPGNLYTRKLEEEYRSKSIELPAGKHPRQLKWTAEEPHGSKLYFQTRTAKTQEDLGQALWHPVDADRIVGVESDARWIQYRAIFTSPDAGTWPSLSRVEVVLD